MYRGKTQAGDLIPEIQRRIEFGWAAFSKVAKLYGAPFSHLFTELKISPIEVHISAIELEISPIELKISAIELQISPNRPI